MTDHSHSDDVAWCDLYQHLTDDHDEENLRGTLSALMRLHANHHEAEVGDPQPGA